MEQLDLVDEKSVKPSECSTAEAAVEALAPETSVARAALSIEALAAEVLTLLVPVDSITEDPGNTRTEFPDEEIAELAEDIALRGILQPIVLRRCEEEGRYRVSLRGEASSRRKAGRSRSGAGRHRLGSPRRLRSSGREPEASSADSSRSSGSAACS
jgi:hypothetical protein